LLVDNTAQRLCRTPEIANGDEIHCASGGRVACFGVTSAWAQPPASRIMSLSQSTGRSASFQARGEKAPAVTPRLLIKADKV
jgi:hypothetical protein